MVEQYKIVIEGTKRFPAGTFFRVDKKLWDAFVAKCKRLKKKPSEVLSELIAIYFEAKKARSKKRKNG